VEATEVRSSLHLDRGLVPATQSEGGLFGGFSCLKGVMYFKLYVILITPLRMKVTQLLKCQEKPPGTLLHFG
jgi:hypothetical protein